MQEAWVRFLGQEHPLEKKIATHSNILAWRTPWREEPSGPQSMGSQESDTTQQVNHQQTTWLLSHPPGPGWPSHAGLLGSHRGPRLCAAFSSASKSSLSPSIHTACSLCSWALIKIVTSPKTEITVWFFHCFSTSLLSFKSSKFTNQKLYFKQRTTDINTLNFKYNILLNIHYSTLKEKYLISIKLTRCSYLRWSNLSLVLK